MKARPGFRRLLPTEIGLLHQRLATAIESLRNLDSTNSGMELEALPEVEGLDAMVCELKFANGFRNFGLFQSRLDKAIPGAVLSSEQSPGNVSRYYVTVPLWVPDSSAGNGGGNDGGDLSKGGRKPPSLQRLAFLLGAFAVTCALLWERM